MGRAIDIDIDVTTRRTSILVAAIDGILDVRLRRLFTFINLTDERNITNIKSRTVLSYVDGGVATHVGATATAIGIGHRTTQEVDRGISMDIT